MSEPLPPVVYKYLPPEYADSLIDRGELMFLHVLAAAAARRVCAPVADWLFRRLGCRARDCVACRRFVCTPRVSRVGVAGGAARPFDDLSHASLDRSGD